MPMIPNTELHQRSGKPITVHETSSYTESRLKPSSLKNVLIGGGLLLAAYSLSRPGTQEGAASS